MSEWDEVRPKRGRPFRRVVNGFTKQSENENAARCGECPKFDTCGYCPLQAKMVKGGETCCRYGYVLIKAERQEERRNGR